MSSSQTFSTSRLVLRKVVDSDYDDLLKLYTDPRTQVDYTVSLALRGESFKENIKKSAEKALLHAVITLKSTGEFIGECGIANNGPPASRSAEFSIGLLDAHCGKGYGREATQWLLDYAFGWLGLHRVALRMLGSNARALKMYKSVGFVHEGTFKKFHWLGGEWVDDVLLAVLYEEWEERRAQS